jgi:DNA-binding NarL/FixJ family response regulator
MARAVNLPSYIRQTRAWVKGQAAIAARGHRNYAQQFRLERSALTAGKPRPYQQKVPDATLADLRGRGMTFTQIARAVGLTRASIRQRLRRRQRPSEKEKESPC